MERVFHCCSKTGIPHQVRNMGLTSVRILSLTNSSPPPGVAPSLFLGVLGLTGLTAYAGVYDILKLQKGQSIVVSGAAGCVFLFPHAFTWE